MKVEDPGQKMKINRQLSGPLLTTDDRIEYERTRDPSEPPMPSWWTEDDRNTGITAAAQLGRTSR